MSEAAISDFNYLQNAFFMDFLPKLNRNKKLEATTYFLQAIANWTYFVAEVLIRVQ